MAVHLSPIGYDSTRVTRPILSEGIDNGDHIILLRPVGEQEDARAVEAIEDVKRMLKQVEPEVTVTIETIPPDDLQTAVLNCSKLITSTHDDLIINFGGGPREVYLPVVIATLAHPDAVEKSLQFSDLDRSINQISLPRIVGSVPESTTETLGVIVRRNSGIGIPDLADELDRPKSTVSRHIKQLENIDVVTSEIHGKTKYINSTFTGELRYQMEAR